jgi:hypothetical protein
MSTRGPKSVSRLSRQHGLHRAEITLLIDEHQIPVDFVGPSMVVGEAGQARLDKLVASLKAKRAKRVERAEAHRSEPRKPAELTPA